MTTNEAAERLLAYVEDQLQPQFKSPDAYAGWRKAAIGFFAARLAAERRATVERIRPPIASLLLKAWDGLVGQDEMLAALDAILDEEAVR